MSMITSQDVLKAFMAKAGMGGFRKDTYGLRELARQSGVPVTTLSGYLNEPYYLNLENKKKVCKVFDIDAQRLELLDGIIKGKLPPDMYGEVMDYFQDKLDNFSKQPDAK